MSGVWGELGRKNKLYVMRTRLNELSENKRSIQQRRKHKRNKVVFKLTQFLTIK